MASIKSSPSNTSIHDDASTHHFFPQNQTPFIIYKILQLRMLYCGGHMDHTQIRPLPSPMHHTWTTPKLGPYQAPCTTPKLGPYQAPIIRRANWSGRTPSMLRVVYKM